MATTVTTAGRAAVGESHALTWLNSWIRSHKQLTAYLGVGLVVALGLFAWNFLSAKTAERSAGRQIAQGQTQQAIDVLQRSAPKADKYFRAQTYGLLGGAFENALRPKDAATAYESAAAAALYPFLRAQFLADAGRAWIAAGDTAKALAVYRTIVAKLDSTSAAGEAKVRLGELTKGSGHP